MLIFLQANHCHAIDLGVLENTNKKELVLAVFLVDGEAAKPTEVLKQPKTPKPKTPKPKTPKPQPIEPKTPQDSEPIEPKPPQDSEPIEPTPTSMIQIIISEQECP